MNVTQITPAHVRLAMQMAAARGLKLPSLAFEEFVAKFLTGLRELTPVCNLKA